MSYTRIIYEFYHPGMRYIKVFMAAECIQVAHLDQQKNRNPVYSSARDPVDGKKGAIKSTSKPQACNELICYAKQFTREQFCLS